MAEAERIANLAQEELGIEDWSELKKGDWRKGLPFLAEGRKIYPARVAWRSLAEAARGLSRTSSKDGRMTCPVTAR